jgi:hypothetical protein
MEDSYSKDGKQLFGESWLLSLDKGDPKLTETSFIGVPTHGQAAGNSFTVGAAGDRALVAS